LVVKINQLQPTSPTLHREMQRKQSMNGMVFSLVITAAMLSGCTTGKDPARGGNPGRRGGVEDIDTWTVVATDPILTVGHGVLLSREGNEIAPTPEFVIEAQRFYLKGLYQQASKEQRDELKAKQLRLQGAQPFTREQQIVVNSALIAWLIDTVKPEEAATLAGKNAALQGSVSTKGAAFQEAATSKGLLERLNQEGLLKR
jgi:hypothetical protein